MISMAVVATSKVGKRGRIDSKLILWTEPSQKTKMQRLGMRAAELGLGRKAGTHPASAAFDVKRYVSLSNPAKMEWLSQAVVPSV